MSKDKRNNLFELEDLMKILRVVPRNILIIVMIPSLFAVLGYYYTYNMTEYYGASSQILIKSGETYDYQAGIQKSIGYYQAFENMSNQMRVLTSRELIGKTIDRLDYNVGYFIKGRLKTEEVVKDIPFKVDSFNLYNTQLYNTDINFHFVDENTVKLTYGSEENSNSFNVPLNEPFRNSNFYLKVSTTKDFIPDRISEHKKVTYALKFYSRQFLVNKFKSVLATENIEYTSIIKLNVENEMAYRAKQFLDTLARV